MSQLARGRKVEEILRGVHHSIAGRSVRSCGGWRSRRS